VLGDDGRMTEGEREEEEVEDEEAGVEEEEDAGDGVAPFILSPV